MQTSLAAGHRVAARLLLAQAGASVVVALLLLVWLDAQAARAAAFGGATVALGSALFAYCAIGSKVRSANAALLGLAAGLALKWLVVVLGLYLALARFELPPLPVLVGLSAALVMFVPAFKLKV